MMKDSLKDEFRNPSFHTTRLANTGKTFHRCAQMGEAGREVAFTLFLPLNTLPSLISLSQEPIKITFALLLGIKMT